MWPLALAALTLFVFTLPLVPAILEWKRRRDIRPLPIDPDHTLDVAFVAAEFRAAIEREGNLPISRGADNLASTYTQFRHVQDDFKPTAAQATVGVCADMLVSSRRLALPDGFTFTRDLYAYETLRTGRCNHLEALLSEGMIVVRDGSILRRWAYGYSVFVEPHCHLLGPVSADHDLSVDCATAFSSLSAPLICFGRAAQPEHHAVSRSAARNSGYANGGALHLDEIAPPADAHAGRWLVKHSLDLPEGSAYRSDIVVHGDLCIGAGTWIAGSIKASGNITIGEDARIDGAIIAANKITLGSRAFAAGPVAAEREIEVGVYNEIGTAACPTTVVAPHVRVHSGAVVHGSVNALQEGQVVAPSISRLNDAESTP